MRGGARDPRTSASTTRLFEIDEIDIEADDVLHARYLERIPVIAIDGEEMSEYFVDEEALIRRILYREGR